MAMAELVATDLKLGHMGLQNRVTGHIPKDAGIFAATFRPRHNFRGANVFNEISFVPALPHALGFGEVICVTAVSIFELKVEVLNQSEITKDLQHERKARDCQEARRLGPTVVVAVHYVKGTGEQTPFAPLNFSFLRAISKKAVAVTTQADENLFKKILTWNEGLPGSNLKDRSIHVNVPGKVKIHAPTFDLRPRKYFVGYHVKHRIWVVIFRDLCALGPVTIEVPFDSSAAADVGRTINRILCFRLGFWCGLFRTLGLYRLEQATPEQLECYSRR